eukprot:COSAG01_NODE_5672_length_4108_cov_2.077825_4_plen_316_part_00
MMLCTRAGNGISNFSNSHGAVTGGQALRLIEVRSGWLIQDTNIIPFDTFKSVLSTSSGSLSCDTSPCAVGEGCKISKQSLSCQKCPAGTVAAPHPVIDGAVTHPASSCHACPAGKHADESRGACSQCERGKVRDASTLASRCVPCAMGFHPNNVSTACIRRECPARQVWVSGRDSASCRCSAGFYNVSELGHICCFDGGSEGPDMDADAVCSSDGGADNSVCLPCPSCVDCTAEDSSLTTPRINSGFGLATYSEIKEAGGKPSQLNVFACPLDDVENTGCLCVVMLIVCLGRQPLGSPTDDVCACACAQVRHATQ